MSAPTLAEGGEAARAYVLHSRSAIEERYPDADLADARVTYLDAGIMNYVYRVDAPGRTFFLKQALPQVKEHHRLGPDLAGVSPARIRVDALALELLGEHLPVPLRAQIPPLAWYDPEHNVLWTEEIAPKAVSLQTQLESGACDLAAAQATGRLLGSIHAIRRGEALTLWPTREEDHANWLRFLRMRTTGAAAKLPPEIQALAADLYREGRAHEQSGMISHLDVAPKNVLVSADSGIALLDFELGSAVADPAFDAGFLAGHYLLMGENLPQMRDTARAAALAIRSGYLEAALPLDPGWDGRFSRYAALILLYRLYGSSPAPYLSPERYDAITTEGMALLRRGRLD